jgi:Kef-type K+ transport system membrane component KefB
MILLQLFEMGLELSLARLKALAKFAFGIGLAQVCSSHNIEVLRAHSVLRSCFLQEELY